jgi:hypothetical protein
VTCQAEKLYLSRAEIALLNNVVYQKRMCNQLDLWLRSAREDKSSMQIGLLTNTFSWLLFRLINESDLLREVVHWELFVGNEGVDKTFRLNVENMASKASCTVRITSMKDLREKCISNENRYCLFLDKLFVETIDPNMGSLKSQVLNDVLFIRDFNSKKRMLNCFTLLNKICSR